MSRKLSIMVLLCAAMLLPRIATAQNVFAKQKVVIADVRDVNDCKLDDNIKTMIRQSFVDACSNSKDYEVFEVNMDDIRRQLVASGQNVSFPNICKQIGSKADYVIFIEVMTNTSDRRNPDMMIYITAKLYRIATASMVTTDMEPAKPDTQSIIASISTLLNKSLGIDYNFHSSQTSQQASCSPHALSIGYVNSMKIIELMPEFEAMQNKLEEYGNTLRKQLEQVETEFNDKLASYQHYQDTYSSETKRLKQSELEALQQRYSEFQNMLQKDFAKKQTELFEPVQAKFKRAVDAVAKSHNCVVFDEDNSVLISKHGAVDLNSAVKRELGIY